MFLLFYTDTFIVFTEYPALGMESLQIGDYQLKVSTYTTGTYHCIPRSARAKRPREVNECVVWVPKPNTASNQWFQVSFHVGSALILYFFYHFHLLQL